MVDSESTALPLGYIPIWLALIFYAFPSKSQPEITNFLASPPPDGFAPLTPQACTPRMQDILACSVSDRIKAQSRFFPSFNLCGYNLSMNRFISQFSKMKTGRKIDFRCLPPPFLKPGIRLWDRKSELFFIFFLPEFAPLPSL